MDKEWAKKLWNKLWVERFTSAFSQNVLIVLGTYLILIIYSFVCVQSIPVPEALAPTDEAIAVAVAKREHLIATLQFFLDALFPSTLTLLISVIIQNWVECAKRSNAEYSFTVITLILLVFYTLGCMGIRRVLSVGWFIVFCVITLILLCSCLASVAQIEKNNNNMDKAPLGIT